MMRSRHAWRDQNISQQNRFTPRDASIKGSGSDGGVVEAGEVDAGSSAPSHHLGKGYVRRSGTGAAMDGVTWGN
jgi:hypothetical protein